MSTIEERAETRSVTWRMPLWVAQEFTGDWSGFRDILNEWAETGEPLVLPEVPDETTSVCMRVSLETLAVLEIEAKRLSKKTKRKWTAGKVARKIYEDQFE